MKFSIIIPVYNVEKNLSATLDSVLAQTYKDWECICVDDGSPDNCGSILDEYAKLDSRFVIIHKNNGGTGSARNAALDVATGDWLAFLDGDDIYNPEILRLCNFVATKESEVDCIRFGGVKFLDGSAPVWDEARCGYCLGLRNLSNDLISDDFVGSFAYRVYKRDKIADLRFQTFYIGQDRAFISDVIERIETMISIPTIGYGYRQRAGSAVHQEWSAKKVCAEIGWRGHQFNIWCHSHKEIAPELWRSVYLGITEWVSSLFFMLDARDQNQVMQVWLSGVDCFAKAHKGSVWARFSMKMFLRFRTRWSALILFYLPYWLKRHGVHR